MKMIVFWSGSSRPKPWSRTLGCLGKLIKLSALNHMRMRGNRELFMEECWTSVERGLKREKYSLFWSTPIKLSIKYKIRLLLELMCRIPSKRMRFFLMSPCLQKEIRFSLSILLE